jgi:hypothetical protein
MFLIPDTEYITTLYLSNIIIKILPTAYVLVLLDYHYHDYEIMSQLSKLACVTEVNRVDGTI